MAVKLNFINRSADANSSEVVVFQKNVAAQNDRSAVAWHVIKRCGQGDNHPFTWPRASAVSVVDSWRNYTPQMAAEPGQLFTLASTESGDMLRPSGEGTGSSEIQVLNGLREGSISASVYKDGKLLATQGDLAPGQKALFQFKPTLWIGVASQIEAGQVMDSATLSNIDTELDLQGIASADIVMTGGGPGLGSAPLQFALENVVMA